MPEEKFPEKIEVESYSGYKANERPVSFWLRGRKVGVADIVDRWYGTEDDFFKVLADDGRVYLLKWQRFKDEWFLVKVKNPVLPPTDAVGPPTDAVGPPTDAVGPHGASSKEKAKMT